jgi:hypothetical protein
MYIVYILTKLGTFFVRYTVKKVICFLVPSRDITNQTLPSRD